MSPTLGAPVRLAAALCVRAPDLALDLFEALLLLVLGHHAAVLADQERGLHAARVFIFRAPQELLELRSDATFRAASCLPSQLEDLDPLSAGGQRWRLVLALLHGDYGFGKVNGPEQLAHHHSGHDLLLRVAKRRVLCRFYAAHGPLDEARADLAPGLQDLDDGLSLAPRHLARCLGHGAISLVDCHDVDFSS